MHIKKSTYSVHIELKGLRLGFIPIKKNNHMQLGHASQPIAKIIIHVAEKFSRAQNHFPLQKASAI